MSNYIFSHSDWASIDLKQISVPIFVLFFRFLSHTTEEDVVTVILGLFSRYSSLSTRACTHILIIPNEILVPRTGFLFRMGLWLIPSSGLLTVERDGLLSAVHFLSTRSRTHLFDIWCYSDVKYVSGYAASPKNLWIIDLTQISLKECFPKLHRFPSLLYS